MFMNAASGWPDVDEDKNAPLKATPVFYCDEPFAPWLE
jgi:hypothetical protein